MTFKAFRKDGDAYVFVGAFSAPATTADGDLWRVADEAAA